MRLRSLMSEEEESQRHRKEGCWSGFMVTPHWGTERCAGKATNIFKKLCGVCFPKAKADNDRMTDFNGNQMDINTAMSVTQHVHKNVLTPRNKTDGRPADVLLAIQTWTGEWKPALIAVSGAPTSRLVPRPVLSGQEGRRLLSARWPQVQTATLPQKCWQPDQGHCAPEKEDLQRSLDTDYVDTNFWDPNATVHQSESLWESSGRQILAWINLSGWEGRETEADQGQEGTAETVSWGSGAMCEPRCQAQCMFHHSNRFCL